METERKYRETKSRHSVKRNFGGRVQAKTKIPVNTCHPGEDIEFRSQEKPPTWNCAKCGGVLRVETVVNTAVVTEM